MTFDSLLHDWPVGIGVIGNDVITACDQSLIDACKEGIRLWRAKDSLERCDANLSHALCATLQEERQQRAHNLGRIQLLSAEEISIVGLGMEGPHCIPWFYSKQCWKIGKMSTHTMRSPERRTKESRMCLREEARGSDWQLNVPRWAAWMALM